MNKQKQALLILFFAIFGWIEISAQPVLEDVIYTNNGSVIRGKIIKNENDTIKIETCGRNIFVYPKTEIIKLIKEEQPKSLVPSNQKGFYSFSTFGLLIGKSDSENPQTFSFHTSVGYQLNHFAGLAVGMGVESLKIAIIPLFISFNSKLTNKENSPFVHVELGYSVPLSKENDNSENYYNPSYKYKGGMNVGLDFGIHSYKTQKRAFVITAGYRYQLVKEIVSYNNQSSYETNTFEFNRLAIKIGFMFM